MTQSKFTAYVPRTAEHGHVPDALTVTPTWFKVIDRGGSYRAEFNVDGAEQALWNVLEWLGRPIEVIDEYGTSVWRGKITEVDLKISGMNVSLSYMSMYNRVNVIYSYQSADGTAQVGETGWADDTMSQGIHGVRELLHSLSDTFSAEAEGKRDRLLSQFKNPKGVPTMSQTGMGATLAAMGYFQFNDWVYIQRLDGRMEHAFSISQEINLGWQASGTEFNFHFGKLHDIQGRIATLIAGNWVIIDGSTYNDDVFRLTSKPSGDAPVVLVSNQITFEPEDDIYIDVTAPTKFDIFQTEEIMKIEGSPNNDGVTAIENINEPTYLDITESFNGFIILDSPGPTVTLTQGISIELDDGEGVASEVANADTLTITALGYAVAQKFTAPGTWDAQQIALTVYRVGTPADNLVVSLFTDNSGEPGTLLGTVSVAGTDLSLVSEQRWFTLPTPVPLTEGTDYWVHVGRSGAMSHLHFYVIGATTDSILGTSGDFLLSDTGSWYARDMSLSFMVYATEDTKDQIDYILSQCDQFGGNVIWNIAETGVRTNQWQDGRARALSIIEELMEKGGPNGRRLIVLDDQDGNYHISEEPAIDDTTRYPLIWADGRITTHTGGPLPKGQLPVGQWAAVAELPGEFSALAGELSPLYVMEAEVDVSSGGTPTLRPRQIDLSDRIERA